MYNRGTKYLEKNNPTKALQCFKKALKGVEFKELYLNLGNTYRLLDQDSFAEVAYTLANNSSVPFANGTFSSSYTLALNNIGLLAYARGDDQLAISMYKQALTVDPLHYDAIWNYGNALLRSSNCSSDTGWKAYEYRFKRSGARIMLDCSVPFWDGVSSGSSICVQTEQGLGDKIMFGRYLSLLAAKFTSVYVVCHPSLDVFYSDYKIVRSVEESRAECTVGICSLAQYFGIVSSNYLDGKFSAHEFNEKEFNIGVVWSGSTTHANNRNRSCPARYFNNLSVLGKLYSLNPDAEPVKFAEQISSRDWSETASNVLGLDLVVAVDTSIVHLCGTLGIPCIMIQPLKETDFRWGKPGDTNVWYPSVTVVENTGWESTMARVAMMIAELKVNNV